MMGELTVVVCSLSSVVLVAMVLVVAVVSGLDGPGSPGERRAPGVLVGDLPHQVVQRRTAGVERADMQVAPDRVQHALQPAHGDVAELAPLQGRQLPARNPGLLREARERDPAGEPAATDFRSKGWEVEAHG